MKDSMENRLLGWTPRRPSRQVEEALFDKRAFDECESSPMVWLARWQRYLNSAAAFAVLVAAMLFAELPAGGTAAV